MQTKESHLTLQSIGGMAILYPLLHFRVAATLSVLSASVITVLTLGAPAHAASCMTFCESLNGLFALAHQVPQVANLSVASHFPFAAGVSYFTALVLGALTALCILFTRFRMLNFAAVRASSMRGRIFRFLGYALWATQFIVAAPQMNRQQLSYSFFTAVGSDRAFLLVWTEGMYVLSVAVLVAMTVDVSQLFRSR